MNWPFGDLKPFSYDLIMAEALIPDARRLELFSRQSRRGWQAFGNEATKFDEAAA